MIYCRLFGKYEAILEEYVLAKIELVDSTSIKDRATRAENIEIKVEKETK